MEFLKYLQKYKQYNETPHTHHSASFIYQHFVKAIFSFSIRFFLFLRFKNQHLRSYYFTYKNFSMKKYTFLLIPSIQ